MAREAGPNPMQRRSRSSSESETVLQWLLVPFKCPLRCSESISPLRREVRLEYFPLEGILGGEVLIAEGAMVVIPPDRRSRLKYRYRISNSKSAEFDIRNEFVMNFRVTQEALDKYHLLTPFLLEQQ